MDGFNWPFYYIDPCGEIQVDICAVSVSQHNILHNTTASSLVLNYSWRWLFSHEAIPANSPFLSRRILLFDHFSLTTPFLPFLLQFSFSGGFHPFLCGNPHVSFTVAIMLKYSNFSGYYYTLYCLLYCRYTFYTYRLFENSRSTSSQRVARDALWACRSAIFKHFTTFTFGILSTFRCQYFCTFTQVTCWTQAFYL